MAGDAAAAGSPADAPAAVDAKPRRRPWVNWGKVGPFIVDNYLPLAFLVAIVWAMAWPAVRPSAARANATVKRCIEMFLRVLVRAKRHPSEPVAYGPVRADDASGI